MLIIGYYWFFIIGPIFPPLSLKLRFLPRRRQVFQPSYLHLCSWFQNQNVLHSSLYLCLSQRMTLIWRPWWMIWTPHWRASTPPVAASRQNPPRSSTMVSHPPPTTTTNTNTTTIFTTTYTTTITITCITTRRGKDSTHTPRATSPRSRPPPPRLRIRPKPACDGHSPCTSSLSGTMSILSLSASAGGARQNGALYWVAQWYSLLAEVPVK